MSGYGPPRGWRGSNAWSTASPQRTEEPMSETAAPVVDGVTVHTRATVYTVNCLPDDPIDGDLFAITVEFRGGYAWGKPRPLDQQWAVLLRGHWSLGHDGKWSAGPDKDDEGYGDWLIAHRFDRETALKVAAEQAPNVTINGSTPADVLARRATQ